MKANLKGGNSFVRFLLAHGEKLGMAAVVVCAGMLIWSAFGRERLGDNQRPDDLQNLINRANTHIDEFRWENADPENIIVASPVSSEAMKPIPREHFPKLTHSLDRPVLDPVGLRTDPALLPAEDLEVHGDAGLWASADPQTIKQKQLAARAEELRREKARQRQREQQEEVPGRGRLRGQRGAGLYTQAREGIGRTPLATKGGAIVQPSRAGVQLSGDGFEEIEAKSWVTVLAKVPVQQQYQIYDATLGSALGYDPARDIPNYVGYEVQRAEVTSTGLGDWRRIAIVSGRSIKAALETYPVNVPEVVAKRYIHPVLTHPLPPLILREWDERTSHSSMPLISQEMSEVLEETEENEEESPEKDDFFAGPTVANGLERGPRTGGASPLRRGPTRGGRAMFPSPGRANLYGNEGLGEYGGGDGDGGYANAGRMNVRRADAELGEFTWDEMTSHVLLRYFDTQATPGHKYRYRIRLVLSDVNNLSAEYQYFLDKSVTDRRAKLKGTFLKYRYTDWSKPSPVVSVPFPARIYLAGAKAAKDTNYNAEPEAELLIKALSSDPPAEVARSEFFTRGSVLNIRDKAKVVWANRYNPDEEPEFDFKTGITLLDFRGGEGLSRKNRDLTAPARAVFMDAAGRLFLQSELDDYQSVSEYREIIETGEQSRRRPRGNDGFGTEGELFGG